MKALHCAVVSLLLLAGCVQPPIEPEPLTMHEAIVMPPVQCLGNFYGRIPDLSAVDPYLPPGFKAADAGTLFAQFGLDLGETGRAFLSVNGLQCESQIDWLTFWILVEEPSVTGVDSRGDGALHWFEVSHYMDGFSATTNLTARGVNVFPMEAEMDVAAAGPVLGRAYNATQGDTVLIEMIHFGAANALTLDNPMSAWQITDDGTHEFRAHIQATGHSGFGSCATNVAWIRDFVASCNDGQALTGTIEGWQMNGTYLFHQGVLPK